jgi:hypothetical protein
VARRVYRWRDRRAFERLFGVTVLAAAFLVERPLLSGQVIAVEADRGHPGWLQGLFVNTGLLPASPRGAGAAAAAGPPPVVSPSHLAWTGGPAAGSTIHIHLAAALPGWAWGVVALIVAGPLVGFVLYRARRPVEADPTGIGVAQALSLALATPVTAPAPPPGERNRGHGGVGPERHEARHRRRDRPAEVAHQRRERARRAVVRPQVRS